LTPLERFESKYITEPNTGCWIWIGQKTNKGYPGFSFFYHNQENRKQGYAHRFSYEQFVGPIPRGKELDHLCRVRLCVNPKHLEPVSHLINVRRSLAAIGPVWPTMQRAMRFCKRGHEFTVENTRWNKKPFNRSARSCRLCLREYMRNYRRIYKRKDGERSAHTQS